MKARIIRPDIEVNEKARSSDTVTREVVVNGELQQVRYFRLNQVVEDPLAWLWVQMGIAEPADEECRLRARRTPEQLAAARHAALRVTAGLHPRDYKKFDAGLITGYLPDGTYRPGPKAAAATKALAEKKCRANGWPLHAPWEIDEQGNPLPEEGSATTAGDEPGTATALSEDDSAEDTSEDDTAENAAVKPGGPDWY